MTPAAIYPVSGYSADRQQQVPAVAPNLQDYALRRQGRGSAAEGLNNEAAGLAPAYREYPAPRLSPVSPLRGAQYPPSNSAAGRHPGVQHGPSADRQQLNTDDRVRMSQYLQCIPTGDRTRPDIVPATSCHVPCPLCCKCAGFLCV
jgi:hypothetical protein